MNHFTTPDFWYCYRHLPKEVRDLADKNFALLRQDPQHPSLRLRKVGAFWRAAVPGTASRPVPILVRSRRRGHSKATGSPPQREGPVRQGSRAGRPAIVPPYSGALGLKSASAWSQ